MTAIAQLLTHIYDDASFRDAIAPDIFPMAVSKKEGMLLATLIDRYTPRVFVELGFRYGIASLWIQSAEHKPDRHIIIDPYHHIPYPPRKKTIDDLIKKQAGVTLEEHKNSQEKLAELSYDGIDVDMAFIDASQWFDSVITDLYFLTRILRKDGIVVIRNMWRTPVRKAVMYYLKNLPYAIVGIAPWQEWIIKYVPIVGEVLLRVIVRSVGLCVLQLKEKDNRTWDHYVPFYL
jgi:predicted O-methyltransferase YrrM